MSGGVAVAAGAAPDLAFRIGASMTLLQLGIGTVNDVVDADHDRGRKPGKPIAAGVVDTASARLLAVLLFGVGVATAASVRPVLAGIAAAVIAIGLAYDLRLKGTPWSWLPFAVGIPLLPVFGWLGATGGLHAAFAVVVPAAVTAGAALAIGNSLVDVERDRAAGQSSIASALGLTRAARLSALLYAGVAVVAVMSAVGVDTPVAALGLVAGAGAIAAVVALRAGSRPPRERELSWRVEAISVAAMAVVWVRAVLA